MTVAVMGSNKGGPYLIRRDNLVILRQQQYLAATGIPLAGEVSEERKAHPGLSFKLFPH